MDMRVYFPGNRKVYADYKGFTIETDQPEQGGGDGTAPSPFDMFVVSIGTCAGIFAVDFMHQRDIPTDDAAIILRTERDPEKRLIGKITLELQLPEEFPAKYEEALIRAVDLCTVKRHLADPPDFDVVTSRSNTPAPSQPHLIECFLP